MKILLTIALFFYFSPEHSGSLFAQNTAADSIKTDIIETESGVILKSTQITSVVVTSQRIAQEIERYRQEEAQIEAKLKQVRNQIKEFERLLGGVAVTEKRIQERIENNAKEKVVTEAQKPDKPDKPEVKKKN